MSLRRRIERIEAATTEVPWLKMVELDDSPEVLAKVVEIMREAGVISPDAHGDELIAELTAYDLSGRARFPPQTASVDTADDTEEP
jgi:hypothetical protein